MNTKTVLGMDGKTVWGKWPKMSKKRSIHYVDLMGFQYDNIRDGEIGLYWEKNNKVVAFFDKVDRNLYAIGKTLRQEQNDPRWT